MLLKIDINNYYFEKKDCRYQKKLTIFFVFYYIYCDVKNNLINLQTNIFVFLLESIKFISKHDVINAI